MVDVAKLFVSINADTSDAEAGFARVHAGIGAFATGATAALAAAGAAIVGLGASAVSSAAEFEKTMSGVKAVSGATADQMKGLSGLALQLGKDTSFSASEAASGIEELVKGGLSISDIMNGAAKSTLDLAAAGGVSLPEAATIAANALAQFGLKGQDMAHVADLIAGAANASALDVGQFKFSLEAAGAVASTIGFRFDDLAVAIAEMGKAGIVGSDAGTSLKTMMLNLQPSTKTAAAEMKQLGIITATGANQFFDAQGRVKSMAEVAQVLQTATKGLTEQQRLQALQTIFGSDAIRAAAVLAREGAGGFDEMAASMGKVTAASVGAERLNNLNGDMGQLQGSIETLAITFGTAFLPVLREATQWATNFVNSLIPWVQEVGPQVVAVLEQLGAAFGDLLSSGDVGVFADDIRESFGLDLTPFVVAIRVIQDAIGAIATGFQQGGLVGAFAAWLEQAKTFGGSLATQAFAWGQTLVDWIAPRVPAILVALGTAGSAVWDWITKTALPTVVERLGAWGQALVDWIGPEVDPMLREAGKLATALWSWITDTAAPAVVTKLTTWGAAFTAWVAPRVQPLIEGVGRLLTALGAWITDDAAPAILADLGAWGAQFTDWIGPATDAFLAAWPSNLTRFLDWIEQDAAPAIYATLSSWVKAFVNWVGGTGQEGTAAGGLFKTIGTIASVLWTFIEETAVILGPRLLRWAGLFLGWVVTDVLPFLATELGKMLTAIGTWLVTDAIPWAGRELVAFGAAIVAAIVAGIRAAPNAIGDALRSLLPVSIAVPTVAAPGAPAVARPAAPAAPNPRAGETVAAGPNFSGQYLYTSDGGRHVEWRDRGGIGMPGRPYAVGVPEVFVPNTPGRFVPLGGAGAYGGPSTVQVSLMLDRQVLARVNAELGERRARRGDR